MSPWVVFSSTHAMECAGVLSAVKDEDRFSPATANALTATPSSVSRRPLYVAVRPGSWASHNGCHFVTIGIMPHLAVGLILSSIFRLLYLLKPGYQTVWPCKYLVRVRLVILLLVFASFLLTFSSRPRTRGSLSYLSQLISLSLLFSPLRSRFCPAAARFASHSLNLNIVPPHTLPHNCSSLSTLFESLPSHSTQSPSTSLHRHTLFLLVTRRFLLVAQCQAFYQAYTTWSPVPLRRITSP